MNRPANRRELLTYINHVSFAVDEAKLYLVRSHFHHRLWVIR